ncbi:MAG: hypothetical protein DHS20C17_05330 [Cyclobacteriaceae bacterium]|nr:MAG: hypothetical protein DHS20C17_05330 [Cyclobacteriaceae bacterium]
MVESITPIYEGVNILVEDYHTLAMRAYKAEGISGKCKDYILNIEQHLRNLNIEDQEVLKMIEAIRRIDVPKRETGAS